MAKPPSLVAAALATWNGKALIKGKKDISSFDKSVKNLGRTFGTVFGAASLVAFSKKAINAFAADEKAAKSLAVQLENTGNAFRVNEVESYIAGLQSLYGVLDDQLRPAFQTLLNATGSVTLSQQALETALNVSAGTGKDLAIVVAAIAKGASGTTTSIARLGTGLDKATIATGDMNKIMAALDAKFAGQAQARLSTYAGKMDLLKVAAADATEIIGKGLIDAISALGKDNSIQDAADSMNNFAVAIADTTRGMGQLTAEIKKMAESDVGKFLLGITALLTLGKKTLIAGTLGLIAYDIGKSQKSSASNMGGYSGIPLQKAENKAIKDAITYRKAENDLLKKKTAVDKLKDKFDLERIGLTAALNAATDKETKLRIEAQIAILDNNEALAEKIIAEMKAAKSADKLSGALDLAGNASLDYFKKLSQMLVGTLGYQNMTAAQILNERLKESGNTSLGGGAPAPLSLPNYFQDLATQLVGTSSYAGMNVSQIATERARESGNRSVDVNLVVSSPAGDRFAQMMAESIQVANRSGYSTNAAGQLP